MNSAEAIQLSLRNIWSTAVVSSLNKILTINTASVCSKNVWRDILWIRRFWTIPGNRIAWAKIRRLLRTVCLMLSGRNQKSNSNRQHKILSCLAKVALPEDQVLCRLELELCKVLDMQVVRPAPWWACNKPLLHINFRSLLNNLCKTPKHREGQRIQNNNSMINVVLILKRQPNKCFRKKRERALNLFCK